MGGRIAFWIFFPALIEASNILPNEELICSVSGCYLVPNFYQQSCSCFIGGYDVKICTDILRGMRSDLNEPVVPFTNLTADGAPLRLFLQFINDASGCDLHSQDQYASVHTCPDSSTLTEREKCEQVKNLNYPPVDYPGLININFKNIYCAMCHGLTEEEAVQKLKPWSVSYTCDQSIDAMSNGIGTMVENARCTQVYERPSYEGNYCANFKIIESYLLRECILCLDLVRSNISTHGIMECILCEFAVISLKSHISCTTVSLESGTLTKLFKLPISLEQRIRVNQQLFKVSQLCAHDEKFDNLFQKCRKFRCGFDQYPRVGECWDNTTVYIPLETQPLPNGTDTLYIQIEKIVFGEDWNTFNESIDRLTYYISSDWSLLFSKEKKTFGGTALVMVNVSDTTVVNFVDSFIIAPDLLFSSEFYFHFYNFLNRSNRECLKGSFQCSTNATIFFVKEVWYAKVENETRTFLYPIDNIFFNISVSSKNGESIIQEICVCDPKDETHVINCSHSIYTYEEKEFEINPNGDLTVVGHNELLFGFNEYYIENSNAYVCYNPASQNGFFSMDKTQEYVSWVCSLISIICLIVTIVTYYIFNELLNIPAKINIGVAVSLVFGQVLLPLPIKDPSVCRYIAAVNHFSWLSAFTWMSAQALQLLVTFHPKTLHSTKRGGSFRYYCAMCISIPFIIVLVCLILDLIPGNHRGVQYGLSSCTWMSSRNGYIYAFFVPIGLSLVFNLICFSLTLYYIEKTLATSEMTIGKKRDKKRCFMYVRLSSVMGFTWIFGFVASSLDISALWYIYIILNGLQGVFIFVSFSCNSRNKQIIKSKLTDTSFTNVFSSSRGNSKSNNATRSSVVT